VTGLIITIITTIVDIIVIIRPYRSTTYEVLPIVTDQVAWSVGQSVGLSVCLTSEPCKSGCTDQDTVWVEDSGWPRNHVLDRGPDIPIGRGNYGGKNPLSVKGVSAVSCARTAQPIDLPFGSWARVG